jgi:hypothetical protein
LRSWEVRVAVLTCRSVAMVVGARGCMAVSSRLHQL